MVAHELPVQRPATSAFVEPVGATEDEIEAAFRAWAIAGRTPLDIHLSGDDGSFDA